MKKLTAVLLAYMCLVSFCSCGVEVGVDSTPVEDNIEVVETAEKSETKVENEETTESEEATEETSATEAVESLEAVQWNFANAKTAESSGVKVENAGEFDSYFDDFQFPENILVTADMMGSKFAIGKDDDNVMLHFEAESKDDETKDVTSLNYTYYITPEDVYSVIEASGKEDGMDATMSGIQHCAVESEDESEEFESMGDSVDWSKSNIKYLSYHGEETIEDVTYDVLDCELSKEDDDDEPLPASFYFTKEGEFFKVVFGTFGEYSGEIQAIDSITVPDFSDYDVKEISAEEVSSSFASMMMIFAFSSLGDAMNVEETTLSEEEIASLETKTGTFYVSGHLASGDEGHYSNVSALLNDEEDNMFRAEFAYPEDGKEFMKHIDAKDKMNITVEYAPEYDEDTALITKVVAYEVLSEEEEDTTKADED